MKIIWDPDKSKSNAKKHDIWFSDTEGVFYDPLAISREDNDAEGESRFVVTGCDATGRVLTIVYTYKVIIFASFLQDMPPNKRENFMKSNYDMSKAKRGAVISQKGKTRITIYIDNEILDEFRKRAEILGEGYQPMINDALSQYLVEERVDSITTLRRIIREELKALKKSATRHH